jgi:hypothetical protein
MGEGAGKWSAEERIRPWEASLPNGTGSEFITALAAQTPDAWATPLLVGLNALAFVAMTIGGSLEPRGRRPHQLGRQLRGGTVSRSLAST